MAFIILKRSRNTRNYYLVENYRDQEGRTRRRTLCYLGREADATDTLEKALAHWKKIILTGEAEIRSAKGARRKILRRRIDSAESRTSIIRIHLARIAAKEAELKKSKQRPEELQHWKAFERLSRQPTLENAKAAKTAFLFLARRLHPDQGGSHLEFIRLKDTYDRSLALWKRVG